MATLSIPKNYQDSDPLFESDLDDIRTAVEDFLNVTKINDDNIQDAGVSRAKLEAVGQQISGNSAGFTTTSSTYVDVSNLTLPTFTTTGRPVILMVTSMQSPGTEAKFAHALSGDMSMQILRDGVTTVWEGRLRIDDAGTTDSIIFPSIITIDPVSAGTYAYKVQIKSNGAAVKVTNCILAAYEL